jgi:hypothetical protein
MRGGMLLNKSNSKTDLCLPQYFSYIVMLYIITDILLKVALSSNTFGHHVIRYN